METPERTDSVCGYERTDATFQPIAKFSAALLVLVVVVGFAMKFLFDVLDPTDNDMRLAPHPMAVQSAPPAPNLQAEPPADLAAYDARQTEILSTYGWVDPTARVVRIPIERAMDLVVERGLPVHK